LRKFGKALCMNHQKDVKHRKANSPKKTTQHNKRYYCNECKKAITSKEYDYSMKYFDEPLCYGCQPEKDDTMGVPPSSPELNRPTGIEIGGKQSKKKMFHDGY